MAWAVVSVFLFVPRISRSSRAVFAITSKRVFSSERSMYCSIHTGQLQLAEVTSASLKINSDSTGTLVFQMYRGELKPPTVVTFDHVKDLRNCCRVLDAVLPAPVVEAARFAGDAAAPAPAAPPRPPPTPDEDTPLMPAEE